MLLSHLFGSFGLHCAVLFWNWHPFWETPNVDLSIFRSPECTFVISDTSASQRCSLGRHATPMAMFGQQKADIMLICYHIWGEQMWPNCLKYRQGHAHVLLGFLVSAAQFWNTERKVSQDRETEWERRRRRRNSFFLLSSFFSFTLSFFNVGWH